MAATFGHRGDFDRVRVGAIEWFPAIEWFLTIEWSLGRAIRHISNHSSLR